MRPRIGIREVRKTLTATVRRVRRAEAIEITHGGDMTAGTPLAAPLRRFSVTGESTASEALEEDRAAG